MLVLFVNLSSRNDNSKPYLIKLACFCVEHFTPSPKRQKGMIKTKHEIHAERDEK